MTLAGWDENLVARRGWEPGWRHGASATELLALAVVVACWRSNEVSWIPDPPSKAAAIGPALGFGVGAGLSFALAEGLPRWLGLIAGVLTSASSRAP